MPFVFPPVSHSHVSEWLTNWWAIKRLQIAGNKFTRSCIFALDQCFLVSEWMCAQHHHSPAIFCWCNHSTRLQGRKEFLPQWLQNTHINIHTNNAICDRNFCLTRNPNTSTITTITSTTGFLPPAGCHYCSRLGSPCKLTGINCRWSTDPVGWPAEHSVLDCLCLIRLERGAKRAGNGVMSTPSDYALDYFWGDAHPGPVSGSTEMPFFTSGGAAVVVVAVIVATPRASRASQICTAFSAAATMRYCQRQQRRQRLAGGRKSGAIELR